MTSMRGWFPGWKKNLPQTNHGHIVRVKKVLWLHPSFGAWWLSLGIMDNVREDDNHFSKVLAPRFLTGWSFRPTERWLQFHITGEDRTENDSSPPGKTPVSYLCHEQQPVTGCDLLVFVYVFDVHLADSSKTMGSFPGVLKINRLQVVIFRYLFM